MRFGNRMMMEIRVRIKMGVIDYKDEDDNNIDIRHKYEDKGRGWE